MRGRTCKILRGQARAMTTGKSRWITRYIYRMLKARKRANVTAEAALLSQRHSKLVDETAARQNRKRNARARRGFRPAGPSR